MARLARLISYFTKQEISRLFKTAKRALKHDALDILIAPQAKKVGRILVVTPRRVGSAPKRNRVRRRLKAIFYEEQLFELGCDCIIIVKKEGVDLPFDTLKMLLTQTVEQHTQS